MFLYAVWCAIALTLCSLESFRVLQNGNYLPQRGYFKLFKSWNFAYMLCLAFFSAVWKIFFPYRPILCAVYTLAAIPQVFVKRKVPLKFTKRIVRMLCIEFFLFLVASSFCLYVWSVFIPFFVLLSWLICLPFDAMINRRYLVAAHRKLASSAISVIAIVGSYGKTTTKNMLSALLDDSVAPEGSCNTPLGIAKFINSTNLSMFKYLILEFGARKSGDIEKLCQLFPPSHGVLTGICPQHLRTFGSIDNIVKEKGKLVSCVPTDGFCVLADESTWRYLNVGSCRKVVPILSVSNVSISLSGISFEIKYEKISADLKLPQIAPYAADTFSACATLCLKLGQEFDVIVSNAKFVKQTPHRLEVIYNGDFYVIDDSYNASVEGIDECCKILQGIDKRKIVIAQGIVECGSCSKKMNYEAGQKLGSVCDVLISCGKNKKMLCAGAENAGCTVIHSVKNLNAAVECFQQYACKDCVLLFQNDLPDVVNV